MFYDHRGGILEFRGQAPRRLQVHEIVVRKLFALELLCRRQSFLRASRRRVQRRGLVRIFAIAQFLLPPQR